MKRLLKVAMLLAISLNSGVAWATCSDIPTGAFYRDYVTDKHNIRITCYSMSNDCQYQAWNKPKKIGQEGPDVHLIGESSENFSGTSYTFSFSDEKLRVILEDEVATNRDSFRIESEGKEIYKSRPICKRHVEMTQLMYRLKYDRLGEGEWKQIEETPDEKIFIKPDAIYDVGKSSTPIIRGLVKIVDKDPQKAKKVQETIEDYQCECDAKRMYAPETVIYYVNGRTKEIAEKESFEREKNVFPGTAGETVFNYMCSKEWQPERLAFGFDWKSAKWEKLLETDATVFFVDKESVKDVSTSEQKMRTGWIMAQHKETIYTNGSFEPVHHTVGDVKAICSQEKLSFSRWALYFKDRSYKTMIAKDAHLPPFEDGFKRRGDGVIYEYLCNSTSTK